jgi:cytochrome c-type biogenesis protein CcmE
MRRRTLRLWMVVGGLASLGIAATLALSAMRDNLVFFYSPSDLAAKPTPLGRRIRIGGLVENGSVHRIGDGTTVAFSVTDTTTELPVRFTGVLPDLFREGQGVVAQGELGKDGVFVANEVLARHDEKYMPPEVAKALKEQGHWKGEARAGS